MLVGDVLAYVDIFSVILLLSLMSRAAAILFVVKRAAEHAVKFANSVLAWMQRLDFRHRREGRAKNRKRPIGRINNDHDQWIVTYGVAWA